MVKMGRNSNIQLIFSIFVPSIIFFNKIYRYEMNATIFRDFILIENLFKLNSKNDLKIIEFRSDDTPYSDLI